MWGLNPQSETFSKLIYFYQLYNFDLEFLSITLTTTPFPQVTQLPVSQFPLCSWKYQ